MKFFTPSLIFSKVSAENSFFAFEYNATKNSATASMEMTLRVLGVGKGDEVIVPSYTYTASCSVICHVGAKPIMLDIQKDSLEMDYEKLEALITEKTKVDVGQWYPTLTPDIQKGVEKIVDSVVENSELESDKQSEVVGALHALIPEYAQYHWRHLHESVKDASYRDYKNQDYYRAVTETIKRYESNVQEKSEFPKDAKGNLKDGKDLMFAAFGSILSVTAKYKRPDGKDFKPDTIENVEMGQQHMSAGVMSGVRNPLAHEEIQNLKASGLFTENDCLDILSLLSHLCRRLDDAVKR